MLISLVAGFFCLYSQASNRLHREEIKALLFILTYTYGILYLFHALNKNGDPPHNGDISVNILDSSDSSNAVIAVVHIYVGRSSNMSHKKIIQLPMPDMQVFPTPLNHQQTHWNDTFSVNVEDSILTVTRTDSESEWLQELVLEARYPSSAKYDLQSSFSNICVFVGKSEVGSKEIPISIPSGLQITSEPLNSQDPSCKHNFSVEKNADGEKQNVTRTDSDTGWDQELVLHVQPEHNLNHIPIFISARFLGDLTENHARELHRALINLGLNVFMVDADAGDSIGPEVVSRLCSMESMIAFCCGNYGALTQSRYSTYHELKFAYEKKKHILPIRLCKEWPPKPSNKEGKEQNAYVFGNDLMYLDWSHKEWNAASCAEKIKAVIAKKYFPSSHNSN